MPENQMKILITGGSGFIGTNLVEYYLARSCSILNLDIKAPQNRAHQHYWKHADICDSSSIADAISQFAPDYIFHLAARTDMDGKTLEDYSANTVGVSNLLEACRRATQLKRVIFASSRMVCRIGYVPRNELDYCPSTVYGESKILGEKLVRKKLAASNLSWLIVRPTSIWGPWFDIPYKNFFECIQHGNYFHPGQKDIKKSFGYVGNTVYELDKLMYAPAEMVNGLTLYLADYPPIEVRKMADLIQYHLGAKRIRQIPVSLMALIAKLGDTAKLIGVKNPPLTTFRFNNLLTEMIYDLAPLREIVGELPYSLESGVQMTADWIHNRQ
jgi:nucleoside-diphosphate-sugar epimerase